MDINPSEEWQNRIIEKIHSLKPFPQPRESLHKQLFPLFNPFAMKKLLAGVVAVAVIAITTGYIYTQNTPYAKAKTHLRNITEALEQLQNLSAGKSVSTEPKLFPTAYAEGLDTTEEAQVTALINEIAGETQSAIETTDEIDDAEDAAEILNDLDNIQDQTVEVLSDIAEDTEDENLVAATVAVIEDTSESNTVIETAVDETESDIETGKKKVKLAIAKKVAEKRQERQAKKLATAEEIMTKIGTDTSKMTEPMLKKYQRVQAILEKCKAENEKCQAGKAKGLATALAAKVRNEERKALHEAKKEESKQLKEQKKEKLKQLKEQKYPENIEPASEEPEESEESENSED